MTIKLGPKGKKSQYYTTNKNPLEIVENHFSSMITKISKLWHYYLCHIWRGDNCVINQKDILPILNKNYKKNGLLNKHDYRGEYYGHHTPM
jgi:hypothetical protein